MYLIYGCICVLLSSFPRASREVDVYVTVLFPSVGNVEFCMKYSDHRLEVQFNGMSIEVGNGDASLRYG